MEDDARDYQRFFGPAPHQVLCLALLAEAVRTFTELWVTLWTSTDEEDCNVVSCRGDSLLWMVNPPFP